MNNWQKLIKKLKISDIQECLNLIKSKITELS